MAFRAGNTYTITATVSNACTTTSQNVTLTIASYSTTKLANPKQATILSWWKDEGTMLGCISCFSDSSSSTSTPGASTCITCHSSLTLSASAGTCSCQDPSKYMDLTYYPAISCEDKAASSMSWTLLKQSPRFEMEMNFSNAFASELLYNLDVVASMLNVAAQDKGGTAIPTQEFTVTPLDSKNLSLSFVITQDVQAGTSLKISNLSHYNQIPFAPFLIDNYMDLSHSLPGVTYLNPQSIATITTMGRIVSNAMQVQSATSGLIPILSSGFPTTAIILVGFLSEIEIYRFINVHFPDNFVLFCENTDVSLFPNVLAMIDDVNEGDNPNSTHGKFAFWGVSTVMLDNSYPEVLKNLGVLAALAITSLLACILRGSHKFSDFFSKIRDMLMWNLTLSFYLGDYTELQLYSMIQLSENNVSSTYSRLSYAFSIIIIVTYSVLMICIAILLNSKKRALFRSKHPPKVTTTSQRESLTPKVPSIYLINLDSARNPPTSEMTLNRCSILVEDFDTTNCIGRNFMLVILGQNLAVILVLFFLQNFKTVQAVLYTILTIAFLALVLFKRPYKSLVQTGILALNNVCKTTMGIIAILLVENESKSFMSQSSVTTLGWVLIYLKLALIGLNAIIGFIITLREIFLKIKKKIHECKEHRAQKKAIKEKKIRVTKISVSKANIQNDSHDLQRISRIFLPPPQSLRSMRSFDLTNDLNQSMEYLTALNSSSRLKWVSRFAL